jgi:predicted short-subunit dehydrogenase-like oxidoreductase (DUF2520 family)
MTAPSDPLAALWVIGPGRLGLALAWQLALSGRVGSITLLGPRPAPPDHPIFASETIPVAYSAGLAEAQRPPTSVLICVPDSAIGTVGRDLGDLGLAPVPVLHTSGVLASSVLSPLAAAGCSTGSLHPLAAVADPVGSAHALRGAWYGVEGSGTALEVARTIVAALSGRALNVPAEGKALYHAAAVVSSNFVVALLAAAERIIGEAGIPPEAAREALSTLAAGAIANVVARGPAAALTGPIARGDGATVALHLEQLSPRDRELYSVLAAETLELALSRGLPASAAEHVAGILGGSRS